MVVRREASALTRFPSETSLRLMRPEIGARISVKPTLRRAVLAAA
jgi:hypothetical protein